MQGKGVTEDDVKATQLFAQAAKQGLDAAQDNLKAALNFLRGKARREKRGENDNLEA
jgi:TPR repeat protein